MATKIAETDITKLYRQHATMLRHTCRRILSDAHSAEDVTQESFIQFIAYASKHVVEHPAAVLYRIATRLAIQRLRARRADAPMQENVTVDPRTLAPENLIDIAKVLNAADEEEAQIAVMHFVEGLSHDEISEVMDLSRRTIGNRLDRFCRRAAKLFALPGSMNLDNTQAYKLVATAMRKQA